MKVTKVKKYGQLYGKSLAYLWRTSKLYASILVLTIPIQALLPAVTLAITNRLINQFNELTGQQLSQLLIVWGLAFLFNNLCVPLTTLVQGKLTDDLTLAINSDMMKKSSEIQTIDYFEDDEFYNDIQLLSQEASWRPVNLLVFGTSILSNAILFISMLGIFAQFHLGIACLMVIALIPQAYIAYSLQQQAFEVLVSNSEASRRLGYYSQVLMTADTIKEVRLYNLYPLFLGKYRQLFRSMKNNIHATRRKKFLMATGFLVMTTSLSLGSFFFIIWQIQNHLQKVGAIMLFSSSIVYAINSMSRLIEDSSLLYDTLLYMEKFFNFKAIPQQRTNGDNVNLLPIKEIEFSHVNFAYPSGDKLVLEDVSFCIKAGERIAIVGENGAGKTTLVKLLAGFYPLTSGEIRINQKKMEAYDLTLYREQIGAIFQDFARFDLSLRENVTLGSPTAIENDQAVEEALAKSGWDFKEAIALDRILGKKFHHSIDVSGGQWQKIALARAFYCDRPLLILDEPSAALDARTEYEIFRRFLDLTKGKTVFFITHRLSSVRQADKILLLKDGNVLAFDTHETLMRDNAYYKELYQMQAGLYYETPSS